MTHSFSSLWTAFWICFKYQTLSQTRRTLQQQALTMLPFLMTMGAFFVFVIALSSMKDPDRTPLLPQGQAWYMAGKVVDYLSSPQSDTSKLPPYFSGKTFQLSGEMEQSEKIASQLIELGLQKSDRADFHIVIHPDQRFEIHAINPTEGLFLTSALKKTLTTPQGAPSVSLVKNATAQEDHLKQQTKMSQMLWYVSFIMPLCFLISLHPAYVFIINNRRQDGGFEFLAMTRIPVSLYFICNALSETRGYVIPITFLCVFNSVFLPEFTLSNWIIIPSFLMLSWGYHMGLTAQVLWFHHRWSQLIGAFLFNPLVFLPMLLFWRSVVFSSRSMVDINQGYSLKTTLAFLSDPLFMLGVSIIVGGTMVIGFAWFLEKRLGKQRAGLTRI